MEWMYRYMVGIQSLGFAFDQVLFTPKPDMRADSEIPEGQERITYAKGSYESRHGLIVSEWKNEGGRFIYNFETPVNAKFYLPLEPDKSTFILNEKEFDVGSCQNLDGCAVIKLEKGKYTIEY